MVLRARRDPLWPQGNCSEPQENPVTYPFDSVAGDVQFTQPLLGERTLDLQEGMVHIELVPELIEDAKIGAQGCGP